MKNHFELRLPLDSYDVKNTIAAEKITGKGFVETLKNFNLFKSEYQVQGFLEGRMLEESPYGLSFPSIIASGSNATVLHYMKNDDDFSNGEMVLLDFGVRWMTMHADISRTVPASGKFNPMQKILYEIDLKAQLAVQRKARRGITMNELNDCCWNSVNRAFKTISYNIFCIGLNLPDAGTVRLISACIVIQRTPKSNKTISPLLKSSSFFI
jgi:Xaa-Pro aminopeptidase